MLSRVFAFASLLVAAQAQQVGTLTPEVHPALTVSKCTASGCTTSAQSIVLDSNWRWLHSAAGSTNCYTGNTWDATLCPNNAACAANCALDGASYSSVYGITTSGNALRLNFVTKGAGTNVGSRTYLMAPGSTTQYQLFNLLAQEFTFTVDVSKLPCGLNGALYFSQMDGDGGMGKNPGNKAGAKYGTGYCDAQCPRDLKFINGAANVEGWNSATNSANSGTGGFGACCNEMDIWEANSLANAYTPHPCDSAAGLDKCSGLSCGVGDRYASKCDADGCDINPYRMGNLDFYGPGKTINTNLPLTVVTQFITDTGTAAGTLVDIKRFYVQGGVTYATPGSKIAGVTGNSINDAYCSAQKTAFGEPHNEYQAKGGLAKQGEALKNSVLVMSIWDDYYVSMLWLNSPFPVDANPSDPGVTRGPCSVDSGKPADVEANSPNAYVIYSDIRWGPINSTFPWQNVVNPDGPSGPVSSSSTTISRTTTSAITTTRSTTAVVTTTRSTTAVVTTTRSTTAVTTAPTTTRSTTAAPTTTSAGGNGALAQRWGQCGGDASYTGPRACVAPWVCTFGNPFYSQCL